MSLSGALQIGRSALTASQIALQVTGNNMANAATPGYTRQVARLTPDGGLDPGGLYNGRGVSVTDVRRQIDKALQGRLEDAVSREQGAAVDQSVLSQVESILNELSGSDLSTQLNKFYSAFSELANNPGATETRTSAVEQGVSLASFVRGLRQDLQDTRRQVDSQIQSNASKANQLLSDIAKLNLQVVSAEQGRGVANDLRDQRDGLVRDLSEILDVTSVESNTGSVDLYFGSTPLVQGSTSLGISYVQESVNNDIAVSVRVTKTGESLDAKTGALGGLLQQRTNAIDRTTKELDKVASTLIFEVNKAHSSGRALARLTDLTGTLQVPAADQTKALNDPTNATLAALPYKPQSGSFDVVVTDSVGAKQTVRIQVDLDGVDNTGAPGFANDTSLAGIVAALNGVANITASVTTGGNLSIKAAGGFDVAFANDTSGVLATLGVNTYFAGTTAADIAVRSDLRQDPTRLVAAADTVSGRTGGSNTQARAIAGLRDAPVAGVGGVSISGGWLKTVERVASETSAAKTRVDSTRLVRESIENQRSAISGVSVDEESINLLQYQRQYQGAARFITVVDQMFQTLLGITGTA